MPEFEDTQPNSNSTQNYTPSTDASPKRKTRRRSGGFKTEVVASSTGNMGEVEPTSALKKERLSGNSKNTPRPERKEHRSERTNREARAPQNTKPRESENSQPKTKTAPENRAPRPQKQPREGTERAKATPQPSPETLAAIKLVEERISARKAERDAKRKDNPRNRSNKKKTDGEKRQPRPRGDRKPQNNQRKPAAEPTGILASITNFFGKLFGSEPTPQPKTESFKPNKNGHPKRASDRSRGGQNRNSNNKGNRQGQNGNRRGQNNRGGQNRKPRNSSSNQS